MRTEYKPLREIRERVSLGMNQAKSGRFGRMVDAFKSDACYWGEHRQWYIVAATNRDADTINRSNFAVLLKLLGGESDTVKIEEASHWACGWVRYLIIDPLDRKALRTAILAHSAISDYPVLDESHWSDLEYTEAYDFAESELKEFDGWETVWSQETQNCGFSENELWEPIQRARERLEEIRDNPPPPPEVIDPNQLWFDWH